MCIPQSSVITTLKIFKLIYSYVPRKEESLLLQVVVQPLLYLFEEIVRLHQTLEHVRLRSRYKCVCILYLRSSLIKFTNIHEKRTVRVGTNHEVQRTNGVK